MPRNWPLGAFASLDAGLGLKLDVLSRLDIGTIHLHAPQASSRTPEACAALASRLASLRIEVTCLFAGFEGESYADIPTVARTVGLVPLATREARLAELKELAEFGQRLGVPALGLHVGCLPHDESDAQYGHVVQAARALCDDCQSRHLTVHLETGQESAEELLRFLEVVDRSNLFVNFDPANMILYGAGDPIAALRQLGNHVRGVHCKDATWSKSPGIEWGTETPLGEGDVDFPRFLATLAAIGYAGPLTIEREIPHEPQRQEREIGQAAALLRQLTATN